MQTYRQTNIAWHVQHDKRYTDALERGQRRDALERVTAWEGKKGDIQS